MNWIICAPMFLGHNCKCPESVWPRHLRLMNGWYTVKSQTVHGEYYSVNTSIGVCTCVRGQDGSLCVHQTAVVVHCQENSLNFITNASSSARQKLAHNYSTWRWCHSGHHQLMLTIIAIIKYFVIQPLAIFKCFRISLFISILVGFSVAPLHFFSITIGCSRLILLLCLTA